jgi:CubicO group peptidase (beta-lactamase class C family)
MSTVDSAGDLWSTADDLLRYARGLEEGALVRADSLRVMRTPHATLPETDRSLDGRLVITGYGYGMYVGELNGRAAWFHSGDGPGYTSLLGWLPDDINLVCLSDEDTVRWDQILAEII